MYRSGSSKLWALVLIASIVAAGPCSGEGRSWPVRTAALKSVLIQQQQHGPISRARVLQEAADSNSKAVQDKVLDSSSMKKMYAVNRPCGSNRRFCSPAAGAKLPL
jgi:hypothetical protein